jgi:hypothetical protein
LAIKNAAPKLIPVKEGIAAFELGLFDFNLVLL